MNVSSVVAVTTHTDYDFLFINIFVRPAFLWIRKWDSKTLASENWNHALKNEVIQDGRWTK